MQLTYRPYKGAHIFYRTSSLIFNNAHTVTNNVIVSANKLLLFVYSRYLNAYIPVDVIGKILIWSGIRDKSHVDVT